MANGKSALIVAAVVTLILLLVALATNEWSKAEMGPMKVNAGLWKACQGSTCTDIQADGDKKTALQAARVLAVLALVALLGMAGLVVFAPKQKMAAVVLGVLVALLGAFAYVSWVKALPDNLQNMKIGYSGILQIVGSVMALGLAAGAHRVL